MNRVIIVGSPRSNGRSSALGEVLFEACIDECPEDELYLVPVSELDIAPCVGCNACSAALANGGVADAASPAGPYCPRFSDDMDELYELLPAADELVVVAPVFFSGAPAPLAALLDRLQPYFWQWMAQRKAGAAAPKRPAVLHVVGEGGDANGYLPLVGKVRSALAVAGFQLERVLDWVGKIDAQGEITAEAEMVELPPLGEPLAVLNVPTGSVAAEPAEPLAHINQAQEEQSSEQHAPARKGPQLDLGAPARKQQAKGSQRVKASQAQSAQEGNGKQQGKRQGKQARQGEAGSSRQRTQQGRSAQQAKGAQAKKGGSGGKRRK